MANDEPRADADEVPLGGNLSASVRVGDTVRRRAGPWTPAVHALLEHLQRVGFGAAPRPLGIDDRGRATLEFISGEAHEGWPDPPPPWMYEDETTIVGAAWLLRRYHDALAGFTAPPEARWRIVAPGKHEVICHNDWAPYNALFRGRVPVVMLDWDSAGPGSRIWDVAFSAYNWIPLDPKKEPDGSRDVPTLPQRAARLATFCSAYGEVDPRAVFDVLLEQLPFFAEFIEAEIKAGDPGFVRLDGWNLPAGLRESATLLRGQRSALVGQR